MNRRDPTGGEAYGTPRNASTGRISGVDVDEDVGDGVEEEGERGTTFSFLKEKMMPRRAPYFVVTVRGEGVSLSKSEVLFTANGRT